MEHRAYISDKMYLGYNEKNTFAGWLSSGVIKAFLPGLCLKLVFTLQCNKAYA